MPPTRTTKSQQAAATRRQFMTALGKSGVVLTQGIVSQEEYNRDLQGKRGLKIYDQMRRSDSTVRAALSAIKYPIYAADWSIQPPGEDEQELLATKLIEHSLMERIDFFDFMRQAFTFLDFGFSVFEQVYAVGEVEGKPYIVLDKMGFRKQATIHKWQTEGDRPGVVQILTSGEKVEIPAIKITHFAYDQEGENYEGISLLRSAYKPYYMKESLEQIDAIAHEKQGLGILKVKTPATAKEEDKEEAREIAREQRASEEAYIEELEGFSFEFMDMKAKTTREVMPSIKYHNRQILQAVLAQFMDIGSEGSSGSLAASENQLQVYMMGLEAYAKVFAGAINKTVIPNICQLNGLTLAKYPTLDHGRITEEDVAIMAEAIQKLMQAGGLTADVEIEAHVREALHLPEMSDEMKENYEDRRAQQSQQQEDQDLVEQARQMSDRLKEAIRAQA